MFLSSHLKKKKKKTDNLILSFSFLLIKLKINTISVCSSLLSVEYTSSNVEGVKK